MAYNVGGITAYVNSKGELISKTVLGADTIANGGVTIIPGIKYKERLTFLDNAVYLQAESCGWTSGGSGTTTLTERDVTVVPLKNQMELCPSDLEKYTLNLKMKAGYNTSIPEEGLWIENYVKNIASANETMLWANAAASTTACEGWLHSTLADSEVNDVTTAYLSTSGTSTSSTYWLGVLALMYNALPVKYQAASDLTLFIGKELYQRFINAMVVNNLYHVSPTDLVSGSIDLRIVGYNIKMVPVNGLNSTDYILLTPASNLVVGVDLQGEDEKVNIRYDESQEIVKASVHYKIGTSYYFGDAIVLGR